MRSFNAGFTTEKNKRTPAGPAPYNLLEVGFATPATLADVDRVGLEYGANLVANGDMELDSGWSDSGAPVITNERSAEQVYGGTYSRKLVVDQVVSGIKSAAFTTVTDTLYQVTVRVYRPAGTSPIRLLVRNGADSGDALSETSAALNIGAWTTLTYEFTELAGGSGAYIVINSELGATTYIDNVSINSLTVWGPELKSNPDEELDVAWDTYGGVANSRSAAQAHGGTYSRTFTSTSGSYGGMYYLYPTTTGRTYRVRFWAYSPDATSFYLTIRMGIGSGANHAAAHTIVPGVWTYFEVEYTEAAGGALARVVIQEEFGYIKTFYVDDTSIQESTAWGPNLKSNPDEELDVAWDTYGGVANSRSAAQAHGGTYSRTFACPAGVSGGMRYPFSTTTGKTYRHNLWLYSPAAATVTIIIYKGSGVGFNYGAAHVLAAGVWTNIVLEVVEAAGGAAAKLHFNGQSAPDETYYVDDIVIEENNVTVSSNLVTNGDMELDSDWADSGGYVTTNEQSSEQVDTGTYSRKLVTPAGWFWPIFPASARFTTVTGQRYRVSCRIYRPSGNDEVLLKVQNGADTGLAFSLTSQVELGAWTYVEYIYTELAGGSGAFPMIGGPPDTVTYIDEVQVGLESGISIPCLVKSWGFIDSNIGQAYGGSIINIPALADLSVEIINSGPPRFTDSITTADPIENVEVTLYQSFGDLVYSAKEVLFAGVARGRLSYDEQVATLVVKGIWSKYRQTIGAGLLITEDAFPQCDPDDVGRMQNIVIGAVSNIPCRAVYAGAVDNLSAGITSSVTTVPLVSTTKFPTAGYGRINTEYIAWTGKTATSLTGVTRGWSGSTAAAHLEGDVLIEYVATYNYQIASHPVKAIGDIYVDGVLMTTDVYDAYTGQAGSVKTGYTGQAIVAFSHYVNPTPAIAVLVANGLSAADAAAAVDSVTGPLTISDVVALFNAVGIDQGDHAHDFTPTTSTVIWKFEQVNSYLRITNPAAAIDNNFESGCYHNLATGNGTVTVGKTYVEEYSGPPTRFRVCMAVGTNDTPVTISFTWGGRSVSTSGTGSTVKSSWYAVAAATDTWAEMQALTGLITIPEPAGSDIAAVLEVWVEIEWNSVDTYDSTPATGVDLIKPAGSTVGVNKTTTGEKGGTVNRSGIAELNGNAVAEVDVGALVTAAVSGALDDAAGTITGTAYGLIERPDHVFKYFLLSHCGFPAGQLGASFAVAGAYYATNGYAFAMLLNEMIEADDLFAKLQVQCRSRFMVSGPGVAQLIVRQTGQSSTHAIPKNEILENSMKVTRSAEDDIINQFTILWDRDMRESGSGAFRGATDFSDATSISRYGTRSPATVSAFYFDAVKATAMVDHVGAYWLALLKVSRRMPSFSVFLDNMEIEPGDIIDLTHPLDNMSGFVVEVLAVRQVLGSGSRNVMDCLEIQALEN